MQKRRTRAKAYKIVRRVSARRLCAGSMTGYQKGLSTNMRIITGSSKGTPLQTLEGEATRPTSERAKEAIFSALHFDMDGRRVLDLFAGSGQMGLEALSRGAADCMFIDAADEAMAVVKANAKRAGLFEKSRFLVSDYRNFIRKAGSRGDGYSLIILDPPYAMHAVGDCLERILKAGIALPGCLFVCEAGEEDMTAGKPELDARFTELKRARYGAAFVRILQLRGEEERPTA